MSITTYGKNPMKMSIEDALALLERQRLEIDQKIAAILEIVAHIQPPIKIVDVLSKTPDIDQSEPAPKKPAGPVSGGPCADYRLAEKRTVPASGPLKSYESLYGIEGWTGDSWKRAGFIGRSEGVWYALSTRGSKIGAGANRTEAISVFFENR